MLKPLTLLPARARRFYKGGYLLDRWEGKENPQDSNYPERWVCSVVKARGDEDEGLSYVEGSARPLKDIIAENPQGYLGQEHVKAFGQDLGLLVKIIDSTTRLMIQVHPNREKAKAYFHSPYGKTECWYILDTREVNGVPPYVLLGFREGITREKWESICQKGDVEEMVHALHRIPVQKGEVYFIDGGVPHAMGSGVFFAEIQEPTDITLRTERVSPDGKTLTDAQMHQGIGFDRMYDCFTYDGKSLHDTLAACRIKTAGQPGEGVTPIVGYDKTPFFAMDEINITARYRACSPNFSVAVVLSGQGTLSYGEETIPIKQADEFFIPAGLAVCYTARTPLKILWCHPPKSENI